MSIPTTKEMPGRYGRRQRPGLSDRDTCVMDSYFETMRHFLQTQERVMTAYMGAAPVQSRRISRGMLTQSGALAKFETLPELAPDTVEEDRGPAPLTVAHGPGPQPQPGPDPSGGVKADEALQTDQRNYNEEKIDRERMTQILLSIVEDKTGYPKDMIGLDQNLEADLGIDSIKRVEIASALLNALPPGYRESLDGEQAKLNTQATLKGMVEILVDLKLDQGTQLPFNESGVGSATASDRHPLRYVVEAAPEPLDPIASAPFTPGLYILTQDRLGLAEVLSDLLQSKGCTVVMVGAKRLQNGTELSRWCDRVRRKHGSIAGIVHLAQTGSEWLPPDAPVEKWRAQLQINEKSFFTLLHDFSDHLQPDAHILLVSALGGNFNRVSTWENGLSLQGGSVGLLKSLVQERPAFRVKAIDIDPALPAGTVADILLSEIMHAGGRWEVGYPGGKRTVFKTVAASLDSGQPPRPALREPVILVTGGARGVTAEAIRELALPGHTLLLTGRSTLQQDEPPDTRDLPDFNALRKYFVAQVRAGKLELNMAGIRQRVKSMLNAREMCSNIEDFRRRGAAVEYFQADVNDETQMQQLIETIYDRYGRIDGVVHGAGIIEDKLLADKDAASWSRVVETRVVGLLLLQKYLKPKTLSFFTVFSSVAGRYGNSGQTDYATANELMNRLCCQLNGLWNRRTTGGNGQRIKIKAFCWGPWGPTRFGTGMVNEFTEAKFNERGIMLVSAAAGRGLFKDELVFDDQAHIEVICGHGPWERYETATFGAEKDAQGFASDAREPASMQLV